MNALERLEANIGYTFRNKELLRLAMTHTSYANERGGKSPLTSNQRLEFLGDSVLGLIVSTYLYQRFPNMPEGKMSKLRATVVCEAALAELALRLELPACLLLGNGEDQTGGREKPSILADAMESLLAAVYLDSDYGTAECVLLDRIGMRDIVEKASLEFEHIDYKTVLQEHYRKPNIQVRYEILSVEGPPHDCVYTAEAEIVQNVSVLHRARGSGHSKKEAEQQAAAALLNELQ